MASIILISDCVGGGGGGGRGWFLDRIRIDSVMYVAYIFLVVRHFFVVDRVLTNQKIGLE